MCNLIYKNSVSFSVIFKFYNKKTFFSISLFIFFLPFLEKIKEEKKYELSVKIFRNIQENNR